MYSILEFLDFNSVPASDILISNSPNSVKVIMQGVIRLAKDSFPAHITIRTLLN